MSSMRFPSMKLKKKEPFGRSGRRWKDKVKLDLNEIG
jgi:hypothetical protein